MELSPKIKKIYYIISTEVENIKIGIEFCNSFLSINELGISLQEFIDEYIETANRNGQRISGPLNKEWAIKWKDKFGLSNTKINHNPWKPQLKITLFFYDKTYFGIGFSLLTKEISSWDFEGLSNDNSESSKLFNLLNGDNDIIKHFTWDDMSKIINIEFDQKSIINWENKIEEKIYTTMIKSWSKFNESKTSNLNINLIKSKLDELSDLFDGESYVEGDDKIGTFFEYKLSVETVNNLIIEMGYSDYGYKESTLYEIDLDLLNVSVIEDEEEPEEYQFGSIDSIFEFLEKEAFEILDISESYDEDSELEYLDHLDLDMDDTTDLSIEFENKIRNDNGGTIDDFFDEFNIDIKNRSDFIFASISKGAEKYKNMTDEDFNAVYTAYKKSL